MTSSAGIAPVDQKQQASEDAPSAYRHQSDNPFECQEGASGDSVVSGPCALYTVLNCDNRNCLPIISPGNWDLCGNSRSLDTSTCLSFCVSLILQTVLMVAIPYCIYSCGSWCFLAFHEWQQVHRCILPKNLSTCWSHHVNYSCHIQYDHRCLFGGCIITSIDGKHPSICDFVPVLSLPLSDIAGGCLAFSCMKNSAMFEASLAWREMNIWVTTAAVDLYDAVLLPNFGKLTGGGWRSVYMWGFGIMSDSEVVHFSKQSWTKLSYIVFPITGICFKLLNTSGSIYSPVSKVMSSVSVSR